MKTGLNENEQYAQPEIRTVRMIGPVRINRNLRVKAFTKIIPDHISLKNNQI